jgi:hypothetical protein
MAALSATHRRHIAFACVLSRTRLLLCAVHLLGPLTWAFTPSNICFRLDTIPTHLSTLLPIGAIESTRTAISIPSQDVGHGLQRRLGRRDGGQGVRRDHVRPRAVQLGLGLASDFEKVRALRLAWEVRVWTNTKVCAVRLSQ